MAATKISLTKYYILWYKIEDILFTGHIQPRGGQMWEPHIIRIAEHEEGPERRSISRVYTAIPVTIHVVGTAGAPPPITVQTADISPWGLSTVITLRILKRENGHVSIHEGVKNSAKMIKYLLADRIVGVGIHILPRGGSVSAMGTVKWHARNVNDGLYSVRAGILLNEIDRADKKEWFLFLRAIYEHLACFYHEGGNGGGAKTPG